MERIARQAANMQAQHMHTSYTILYIVKTTQSHSSTDRKKEKGGKGNAAWR